MDVLVVTGLEYLDLWGLVENSTRADTISDIHFHLTPVQIGGVKFDTLVAIDRRQIRFAHIAGGNVETAVSVIFDPVRR